MKEGQKFGYSFQRLEVWQLSMELVNYVYELTKKFPTEEKFALISQLRRAVISVPLNISEGSMRRTKKDFASFTRIALGSLVESITCMEIAKKQEYIATLDYEKFNEMAKEIYFKIIRLNKFLTSEIKHS